MKGEHRRRCGTCGLTVGVLLVAALVPAAVAEAPPGDVPDTIACRLFRTPPCGWKVRVEIESEQRHWGAQLTEDGTIWAYDATWSRPPDVFWQPLVKIPETIREDGLKTTARLVDAFAFDPQGARADERKPVAVTTLTLSAGLRVITFQESSFDEAAIRQSFAADLAAWFNGVLSDEHRNPFDKSTNGN